MTQFMTDPALIHTEGIDFLTSCYPTFEKFSPAVGILLLNFITFLPTAVINAYIFVNAILYVVF